MSAPRNPYDGATGSSASRRPRADNNGIIQENLRHDQSRIVKYNHLVANLIILYIVNAMTRAIKRVRCEGVEVRPEHLAELSPYRTGHINLLGRYPLEVNRRAKAQVYRL